MQEIVKDLRQLAADVRSCRPEENTVPVVSAMAGKLNVWAFTAVMFMLCILAILIERSHSMSKIDKLIQMQEQQIRSGDNSFKMFMRSVEKSGVDFGEVVKKNKPQEQK